MLCALLGRDIYDGLTPYRFRVSNGSAKETNPSGLFVVPTTWYDSQAKELYGFDGNDTQTKIYKFDSGLTTRTLVYTLPAGYKFPASCSPLAGQSSSRQLFYASRNDTLDNKTIGIHRLDLATMTDTAILTQSDGSTIQPGIRWIAVSKSEGYVFYTLSINSTPNVKQIRRCNSDGSNDILIWDGQAAGGFAPFTVGVDDTGKFLYWDEANLRIHRSLFDGTGETTILDRDASIPPLPNTTPKPTVRLVGWSQKRGRLYFDAIVVITLSPDSLNDGLGIWSMKNDGTDLQPEMVAPNVLSSLGTIDYHFHQSFNFVLGSGYAQE